MNIPVVKLLIFLAFGVVLGGACFGALKWNVQLYCGNSSTLLALSIHALRLLGTAAVFIAIARTGAASLLSALVGFQCVRILAVRAKGPAPGAMS